MNEQKIRCSWAKDDLLIHYHDTLYGRRRKNDLDLFSKLRLEGFQAGLSWRIVLVKQSALEKAFYYFNSPICAELNDSYLDSLMNCSEIIRNRRKIYAVRKNARAYLAHYTEPYSFYELVYSKITPKKLSSLLKKQGFLFCGETICESFLMSVGAIEGHEENCYLYNSSFANNV